MKLWPLIVVDNQRLRRRLLRNRQQPHRPWRGEKMIELATELLKDLATAR